jgi:putative RecB family exonuclease
VGGGAYARDVPLTPSGSLQDPVAPSSPEVPVAPSSPETPAHRSGRSRPGLSPSRANDFVQCPLLFRFRVVDRLPEPTSEAAARGTLVHAVLERLFDSPAGDRTEVAAKALLPGEWDRLRAAEPKYAELFGSADAAAAWLVTAGALLTTYFTLEDPNRLEPKERELFVETTLDGGPLLRGIVDRLDVAPGGAMRVVDYKTGKSPRAGYESSALFQMRFYALVLWRIRGEIPRMLQLVYLGDAKILRHEPEEAELLTVERRIRSIWSGIEATARSGDWQPRKSALCPWCAHQSLCPAFGGTPPALESASVEIALGVHPEAAEV